MRRQTRDHRGLNICRRSIGLESEDDEDPFVGVGNSTPDGAFPNNRQ